MKCVAKIWSLNDISNPTIILSNDQITVLHKYVEQAANCTTLQRSWISHQNRLTTHHTHTFITTSLVCAYYSKQVEVDTTFMNQPLLCGSKTPRPQTIFHLGNQFYIYFSISFRSWAFVWLNVCKVLNHLLNLVLSYLNLFLWFCVRIVKFWFNVSYACFQVVAISQITKIIKFHTKHN
jgi:hypothetical protein